MSKYRGYVKVHEDDKKAILKHPAGHEIHLSKKGLGAKLQKQLAELPMHKMAKGGEVTVDEGGTASNPASRMDAGWGKVIIKDKEDVQKFADGGMSLPSNVIDHGAGDDQVAAQPGIWDSIMSAMSSPQSADMAASMPPEAKGDTPAPGYKDVLPQSSVIPRDTPEQLAAQSAPVAAPELQNAQIPAASPTSNIDSKLLAGDPKTATKGLDTQMAGIRQEAGASKDIAAEQLRGQEDLKGHLVEIAQNTLKNEQHYSNESQAIVDDLKKGHIDPEHFWSTASAPGKTSAAIGIMLGSIGSAITGQDNAALTFINRQIERDIDAQKSDRANKYNLLGALDKQFDNQRQSQDMLKSIYLQKNISDATSAALRQGGPMAEAQMKQKLGPLIQEKVQLDRSMALNQSILQQLHGRAAGNPELTAMAIERTSLVPEHQKAEALKQLDETQKQAQAIDHITDVMKQMDAQQTIKNRTMHPIDSAATMDRLKFQVMSMAKDTFGRVNEIELEKTLDNAVKLFESPANRHKGIQIVRDMLKSHMSAPALTGNGLPLPKPKPFTPTNGAY